MTIITINLGSSVVTSESASKPSHKIARVNGVATLVINADKKAELNTVIGHLKKAKASGIAAAKNFMQWDKQRGITKRAATADAKKKSKDKAAVFKQKASASLKEAKLHFREAASYSRKHGLSGLKSPISASDLTGMSERGAVVMKALRTAKIGEFQVQGKRGTFKPRYLKADKFEALGSKTITKAAKTAPAPAKVPANKARFIKKGPTKAQITKLQARIKAAEKEENKSTKATSLDDALVGDSSKKVPKLGRVALDSFTNKRIPGTKITVAVNDHKPASKEIKQIVKSLVGKGGVSKGKFQIQGNSIEYKLGTARYRMHLNRNTGKWDAYANFGGNGTGSRPHYGAAAARKHFETSVKKLQKHAKVDRMVAQNSW